MKMKKYRRLNIVGASGSGKSSWAKKIATEINAPHIGFDELFWGANWSETPDDIFLPRLENALKGDSWVLDGNYNRTIPIKWKKVEAVIWIDLPFFLTLKQAIFRAIKRAWSKEEIWPNTGNYETFRKSFFSKDSIILWTITSYKNIKERYESYMKDPKFSHIDFYRVRNHKEMKEILDDLSSQQL